MGLVLVPFWLCFFYKKKKKNHKFLTQYSPVFCVEAVLNCTIVFENFKYLRISNLVKNNGNNKNTKKQKEKKSFDKCFFLTLSLLFYLSFILFSYKIGTMITC